MTTFAHTVFPACVTTFVGYILTQVNAGLSLILVAKDPDKWPSA